MVQNVDAILHRNDQAHKIVYVCVLAALRDQNWIIDSTFYCILTLPMDETMTVGFMCVVAKHNWKYS